MTEPSRVAAYIRVSDQSQVQGYSLDAQNAEIGRWCDERKHALIRAYREEGVSARSERIEKRPQLAALLADAAKHEFDIVVVHTLDRWARNSNVQSHALEALGRADVGFASVVEGVDFTSPTGRLTLTVMGALNQFFSDQLGTHVRKAQRRRADLGLAVGPIPFGYRRENPKQPAVPEAREGEAVHQVFRMRAAGKSMGAIAEWLNDEGHRTRDGNAFTAHAVRDMLACRFYLGAVKYGDEELPGKHGAIVSEELWEQVQARKQQRSFQRQVSGNRGLLQGRISCVRCGQALQSDRNKQGPMYRERHARACETNNRSAMAAPFEEQVGEIITALELPEDWKERVVSLAATAERPGSLVALKEQRRRVGRAYANGAFSDTEYDRRVAEIDAKIREAVPVETPSIDQAAALLSDIEQLWRGATPAERSKLVEPLIERAFVDLASKRVCAIIPTPALRLLLERAIQNTSRSDILLVSKDEAERLDIWRWWRRGRVELPVQRRAGLRSYRCVRRLLLVRWAVAGPASPARADGLRRSVSASGRSTPTGRRRSAAHRGEACGRRHRAIYAARAKFRSPGKGLPPV